MWLESVAAVNKYLADEIGTELSYRPSADMRTGRRTATTYGALDAFFPAVLALSGDLARARRLQASAFKMWRRHGIEPEEMNYKTMEVKNPGYPLRPEIVESAYYLHRLTRNPAYLRMGRQLLQRFRHPLQDRRGLRRAEKRRHQGEGGLHGELRLRGDLRILLLRPARRARLPRCRLQHRGAPSPKDLVRAGASRPRKITAFRKNSDKNPAVREGLRGRGRRSVGPARRKRYLRAGRAKK